eukprot:scaffold33421_cov30-Tisochrysis_lutea.AAC.2
MGMATRHCFQPIVIEWIAPPSAPRNATATRFRSPQERIARIWGQLSAKPRYAGIRATLSLVAMFDLLREFPPLREVLCTQASDRVHRRTRGMKRPQFEHQSRAVVLPPSVRQARVAGLTRRPYIACSRRSA